MPIGFGIEPPGRGPRGFRADQPPPNQSDDIHAIRERYCGPQTISPQNLGLTANQAVRFDLTGTKINAFLLTVATGQINAYFGDYTSGNGKAAVTPHVVASATVVPQTIIIPLPPGADYVITIQEGAGGTATGTFIPIYE